MLRHEFYRLETVYGTGAGTYSEFTMVERGLDAPELDMDKEFEFWFTKKGFWEVGRHCLKTMRRRFQKAEIRIRPMDAFPDFMIEYKDELQIAVKRGTGHE
jgi:hypothetical protein